MQGWMMHAWDPPQEAGTEGFRGQDLPLDYRASSKPDEANTVNTSIKNKQQQMQAVSYILE